MTDYKEVRVVGILVSAILSMTLIAVIVVFLVRSIGYSTDSDQIKSQIEVIPMDNGVVCYALYQGRSLSCIKH